MKIKAGEGALLGIFLILVIMAVAVVSSVNAGGYDTVIPIHSMDIAVTVAPLININTASVEELKSLDGIGETLAGNIIDWRNENGPFVSIDQLTQVPGIGDSKLEAIRDKITIE